MKNYKEGDIICVALKEIPDAMITCIISDMSDDGFITLIELADKESQSCTLRIEWLESLMTIQTLEERNE